MRYDIDIMVGDILVDLEDLRVFVGGTGMVELCLDDLDFLGWGVLKFFIVDSGRALSLPREILAEGDLTQGYLDIFFVDIFGDGEEG